MTVTWAASHAGEWRGLHDHFPHAVTPELASLLCDAMPAGEATYFEAYGLPARTMRADIVHGRVFIAAEPLVGSFSDRLPPPAVLWFVARAVPAFRRRTRAARRALASRPWLAEVRHWYDVERPAWEARGVALAGRALTALDDAAFVEHLAEVRATAREGYEAHFRLHGPDLMPTALFLTRAGDWGIAPSEAARLLTGASPASTGAGGLPDGALVSGYDLGDRTAGELPARVVPGSEAAGADGQGDEELAATLRARVPSDDRAEWDVRLADARATYGVRDDNGLLTAAWPMGLLRLAMLAAGDRLVARGRLHERDHAIELTVAELVAALSGSASAPTADEAEARAAERRRLTAETPPQTLGPEQTLPIGVLPDAMGLMLRSLLTLRDLATTPPGDRPPLQGDGIGDHPVTGRACVAVDPVDALTRFEAGDIVVTAGTAPAWNTVLALAGGVVTEEGGPLSHAAVIARELGLPALVGAAEALALVPDGATVELDPVAGTIRVLS